MIKRSILLIIFTLSVLAVMAQDLHTEVSRWDFGTIREADGTVSHTFEMENRGEMPLVILDVVTSCGCTVADFSRKPIPAGGTTAITVKFDPANRAGIFEKNLTVYTSDRRKAATLTVCGQVIGRTKSVEELYPVDAGGGLRLSTSLVAFTYVYTGARMQSSVGYANTSSHPVKLELRPTRSSGLLETHSPILIGAGERGEINVAYENPMTAPRYGTLSDALEVAVNDHSAGVTILVHGIGADNPAAIKKNEAPKGEISENIIKFGAVKRSAGVQHRSFTLSNTGQGGLKIRAVEHGKAVATSLHGGGQVAAGDVLRVEVTFDPAKEEYGIATDHIVIITNDPERPMRRIRVTAIVEE